MYEWVLFAWKHGPPLTRERWWRCSAPSEWRAEDPTWLHNYYKHTGRDKKHINRTNVRNHRKHTIKKRIMSLTNLFEKCHGKLLMWDAVLGRANVLLGLIRDVEVDPHQEILLEKSTWIIARNCESVHACIGFLVSLILLSQIILKQDAQCSIAIWLFLQHLNREASLSRCLCVYQRQWVVRSSSYIHFSLSALTSR